MESVTENESRPSKLMESVILNHKNSYLELKRNTQ